MADRIKNIANESVLSLIFMSLVVIYLIFPQNSMVTLFGVITLTLSLVVALIGDWNDLRVLGIFAGLVSLVAARFWGQARFGSIGGIIIPIIWLGVLVLIYTRIARSRLVMTGDRVILVRSRLFRGQIYSAPPPPFIPPMDRIIGTIPLYDLTVDTEIKKINTPAGHDVDLIVAHIRFRVASRQDAKKVVTSVTNRDQAQTDRAKEMGESLDQARTKLAFWEKLLQDLVRSTVEDIVREVIFDSAQNAVDAYHRREMLAEEVRERLNGRATNWGVVVTLLDFERFEVEGERFRIANMESVLERETRLERIKAEREATRVKLVLESEVGAEAQRVTSIINALRESGVDITPEVVLRAMRAASDWIMEGDYTLLQPPAPPTPPTTKPAGDKKDNGARKP